MYILVKVISVHCIHCGATCRAQSAYNGQTGRQTDMTKLMLTNSNYVTVNRNQQTEPEMSNSVKVNLTSCLELNSGRLYETCFNYIFRSPHRKDSPTD